MKADGNMSRIIVPLFILVSAIFLCLSTIGLAENPYRLKKDANGQRCLKCHDSFREKIELRYVHPLMKKGTCTGCHDPHTSPHDDLLLSSTKDLCYDCHRRKLRSDKAQSVHPYVREGECSPCHNSHGSEYRYLLKQERPDLCLDCHTEVGEKAKNARFQHDALKKQKGCLNCHDAHASDKHESLLKKDISSLCRSCHKTRSASFKGKHLNYSLADSNCISCHDVHGSDRKGMLYDTAHTPFLEKKCSRCHYAPGAGKGAGVQKKGAELCTECHRQMLEDTWNKNRVHWSLLDEDACLNCHNPHATKQKGLVKGSTSQVCGACHADTVELQAWSRADPENKHLCEPVKKGNCVVCHDPHASNNVLLMRKEDVSADLCGGCHEWQKHSSHPLGSKVVDQRNPNITVECVSCHKGCGTENNPVMMHYPTTYEMCVQCHTDRKR